MILTVDFLMVLIYYINLLWVESCDYSFVVVDKFIILFVNGSIV